MFDNGFESRVKIQQIIDNQLPEFILDENPKASEFLKQYYISQEFQSGPVDISENLDQYLNLDNLIPEVVVDSVVLENSISSTDTTIVVSSTKGFPKSYGLLKIDDEIITYTDSTETSFIGCIRGFSGVTNYHKQLQFEELVFSTSSAASHSFGAAIQNLSSLFLKEFYKKIKFSLTPGLENVDFYEDLNVGNFIKNSRTFYQTKGTPESFRILFNVLYGETPTVIDLEQFLIKSSDATYSRRNVATIDVIYGDPTKLIGQTIVKSNDSKTTASVSEVETVTQNNKTYYKLYCFIGYDDTYPSITGEFEITATTRSLDTIVIPNSSNNSVIVTVDSTIGFSESGSFYLNQYDEDGNFEKKIEVFYSRKTVNEFLNCYTKGESFTIDKTSVIYSDNTYYGYEDGDTSNKVEFRITGVLSNLDIEAKNYNFIVGEELFPKNVGKKLETGSTKKQIFANNWIYNTASRYQVDSLNNKSIILKTTVDECNLSAGDYIEFLKRDLQEVIPGFENVEVVSISNSRNQIELNVNTSILDSNLKYDIRRKTKKATSSIVPIEFGNNQIFADVQNVYDEDSDYMYVASNSLPSYEIQTNVIGYNAVSVSKNNINDTFCTVIKFDTPVSFVTGDRVYYETDSNLILGIQPGSYYVKVLSDKQSIKLYQSRTSISSDDYIIFESDTEVILTGIHKFTLYSQKSNLISAQGLFRKFKVNTNIFDNQEYPTEPGPVGMLKNGVEIYNYKSNNKLYYGPIQSVDVVNGGNDYDVINPPKLELPYGTAVLQPVVSGSVKKVYVDPQDFNIDQVISIDLKGGNGSGAVFEPVIERQVREIEFDARPLAFGGGLDVNNETIVFTLPHNLYSGQPIVYNSNNNEELGIGTYKGSNLNQSKQLINNAIYYPEIVNDRTVKLYQSISDYNSGINTVGFTTYANSGIHKFKTEINTTLKEIKVIDGGSGYTNRKLRVSPVGVSTFDNSINYTNHGFSSGELVEYSYQTSPISGLSNTNQYYVLKLDSDRFRLCDAGIGGTDRTNYDQGKYVKFTSTGSGHQTFSYPDITLTISCSLVGIATTTGIRTVTATPIIRGEIKQVYIYDAGSDYGSLILNVHQRPEISIKNGSNAQFIPLISNGKIYDVVIQYGGSEYYSTPDLTVYGTGVGAILKPVLNNNIITDVVVVSSGMNYDKNNTAILATPAGKGAVLRTNIRPLTVNNSFKYGKQYVIQNGTYRDPSNEILLESNNNLQYAVLSYSNNIKNNIKDFGEENLYHSGIIGWAYDGNPIYGPYGYSDPSTINSSIKKIESGYTESIIENRPSLEDFPLGYFVEDYEYTANGDLDEYNGRFGKTIDFPNGVYAYFATVDTNINGDLIGKFPYFIGNQYHSECDIESVLLDQSFDFNNSSLIRNTLPYKANDLNASNDFIIESNEIVKQKTLIESVTSGSVDGLVIINKGSGYSVGDSLIFDEVDTDGSGASAKVSYISGKEINDIQTEIKSYTSCPVLWESQNRVKIIIDPSHEFVNQDGINVSGLSTQITDINNNYTALVTRYSSILTSELDDYSSTGDFVDIYLSNIPQNVSIGSSFKIGNETFKLLNKYSNLNVIRAKRGTSGVAHSESSVVDFIPNTISINASIDNFNTTQNYKKYFNPVESVGIGTTSGAGTLSVYNVGITSYSTFIPSQSIYIPDHGFRTGQKVTFRRDSSASPIAVKNQPSNLSFDILSSVSQNLFVINKSKDYIGIVTNVGLTTSSNGLYFVSNGSDVYDYSVETTYDEILVNVSRINSTVSLTTSHTLRYGDQIALDIKPNLSIGIGNSSAVRVKINDKNKILINPTSFVSSGIDTNRNSINITNHNFKTGDKVYFETLNTLPVGLTTGEYFVYTIDTNTISLCETYASIIQTPPKIVKIDSIGSGIHVISSINPEIIVTKNNNLVFDLTDDSLVDYELKLYNDVNFNKEFVSIENQSNFSITKTGIIGITTDAALTLNYSDNLPSVFFYNLEKNGKPLDVDQEVVNYSKINYENSSYSGLYNVVGLGETTFTITLQKYPERTSYLKNECEVLKYITSSKTETGGIEKISIVSGGYGYKKIPLFDGINSSQGSGAVVIPTSTTIGNLLESRIINEGFEYSSDKTLRPTASIPTTVYTLSSNTITDVSILSGGKNYTVAPDLVCIDTDTGELINSGYLKAVLTGTSISSVKIIESPKGLPDKPVTLRTVNNSNGITIDRVQLVTPTKISCTLTTPLAGFSNIPFTDGDKIFVEGITKSSSTGSGFNSSDYGYQFFTVSNFYNTNPAKVEFDLAEFTSDPGTPNPIQSAYASIVKLEDYPQFEVTQDFYPFLVGESLLTKKKNESDYQERQLKITYFNRNLIKISGEYELSVGEKIKGFSSFAEAEIAYIEMIGANYDTNYFITKNIGWKDSTGNLSDDKQVLADNDYFQNLSYTVKSTKTWEDIVTPVNNLLHTSGLKNFADTQLINTTVSGMTTNNSVNLFVNDYVADVRVDVNNNFDLVRDIDTFENKSKFLKFSNVYLSDFFLCKTNRVLSIDDFSAEFSSYDDERSNVSNILDINYRNNYYKFLVLVTNTGNKETQFNEIITINNANNIYTGIKGSLSSVEESFADISGFVTEDLNFYLKFAPNDPYNSDFDIKILQNTFTNTSGIGSTERIGFIDIISSNKTINSGITTHVIKLDSQKYTSLYANIFVTNQDNSKMNYVDVYLSHNGTDTYISQSYFDNFDQLTPKMLGQFIGNLSPDGDLLLNYQNNTTERITVKAQYVGFGTTSLGNGLYRFKLPGQISGNERTVVLNSQFTNVSGSATSIVSLDKNLFSAVKSTVKVGYGLTSALHQVLSVFDGNDVYTTQYPFLSIGSTTGIGTFGGTVSGNNFSVNFYPDSTISNNIEVLSFNESFYTEIDSINVPPNLVYDPAVESVKIATFYGVNSKNIDKLDFEAKYNEYPIFVKTFNPADAAVLNPSTGIFTIPNHFFSTGERLIYTPKSTFIGVGTAPIGIGATMNYVGVVTTLLPETVYAIKLTNNTFKISTRKDYSLQGIGVTFTSFGLGNAHEFEMYKKNEKCLITINDVTQYPLSYTYVTHSLNNNGGQIGTGTTIFALSGISSIRPTDLLKIEDEFVKVNNVGFGTTSVGPITFTGSVPLVEVVRGFVGTSAGIHTDTTLARVYRGSYSISGNKIYFTQPPRGNSLDLIFPDERNLQRERAKFNGRVFLRKDYTSNRIFDDLSDQFTGIAQTFRLTTQGINTVGLGTTSGNGLVFINSIFQSPTTLNNSENNYYLEENLNTNTTTITFTGITSTNDQKYISPSDINQNQLPRGGIIVSLGSTAGLGYSYGTYENLPIIGVSRLGVGQTTDCGVGLLMNVEIGASSTTGIGSTLFEVKSFKITRNGYSFRRGDVFKPVGLNTDPRLPAPISEFKLTVLDTFNDSFGCWQLGEFDYIDSVKDYQDGVRTRFPLYYNGNLLSFQVDAEDADSQLVDLDSVLVIFINGILQEPKRAYQFSGGTTFSFTVPPKTDDNIAIFFYRGTVGEDSFQIDVNETIKVGDTVQVFSNNGNLTNTITQNKRTVYTISAADKIETDVYTYQGIDEQNPKPLYWTKQKADLVINGDVVSKARESLEPQLYPTANIIKNFGTSDKEIFVDDTSIFNYENDNPINFDAIIYKTDSNTIISETIRGVKDVKGFQCAIVGISTTSGIGTSLALKFTLSKNPFTFPDLQVGYPIYISNTNVGQGVISINTNNNDVVAISTSYLNNIYYVHAFNSTTGIITCNISSNTSIVGIATTGTLNYPVGALSWGRLSGFNRSSNPISLVVNGNTSSIGITTNGYTTGLSTYPTIQRRGTGLRNTGALSNFLV